MSLVSSTVGGRGTVKSLLRPRPWSRGGWAVLYLVDTHYHEGFSSSSPSRQISESHCMCAREGGGGKPCFIWSPMPSSLLNHAIAFDKPEDGLHWLPTQEVSRFKTQTTRYRKCFRRLAQKTSLAVPFLSCFSLPCSSRNENNNKV